MLSSSKLVDADGKSFAVFTRSLVRKKIDLRLASGNYRKWLKYCKNQTMLEKRKYTYFLVYVLRVWSQLCKNTQNKYFLSLLNPLLPSMSKGSPIKVFSTSNLTFVNPYNALFGLKLFKKFRYFQCTGLLVRCKLEHVDTKKFSFIY